MEDTANPVHYRCAEWVHGTRLAVAGTTSDDAAPGDLHLLEGVEGSMQPVASLRVAGEASCTAVAGDHAVWVGTSKGHVRQVVVATDAQTQSHNMVWGATRQVVSKGVQDAAITAVAALSPTQCLVGTECGSLGVVDVGGDDDAAPVVLPAYPKLCQYPVLAFERISNTVFAGITPRALFLYDTAAQSFVLGPITSDEARGAFTSIAARYDGCELFVGARASNDAGHIDVMDLRSAEGKWAMERTARLALPAHHPHLKGWHPVALAFSTTHRLMIAYNTGCVSRAIVEDAAGGGPLQLTGASTGESALGDALQGAPAAITALRVGGSAVLVPTRGFGVLLAESDPSGAAALV
eukprot:TRINITY_DN2527_c0_g1_i3.p1 TRINITY_DN2527_c0_g1~~TRINITY_DN2527_c0_g1_i3.p1  ORF type:complete len:352 (+),score=83.11 TRINITY_DN2527_c0_g1_i3:89-1144(+)